MNNISSVERTDPLSSYLTFLPTLSPLILVHISNFASPQSAAKAYPLNPYDLTDSISESVLILEVVFMRPELSQLTNIFQICDSVAIVSNSEAIPEIIQNINL